MDLINRTKGNGQEKTATVEKKGYWDSKTGSAAEYTGTLNRSVVERSREIQQEKLDRKQENQSRQMVILATSKAIGLPKSSKESIRIGYLKSLGAKVYRDSENNLYARMDEETAKQFEAFQTDECIHWQGFAPQEWQEI